MFSGVGDQSPTQVQQRYSSAGQEMWPCSGEWGSFLIFCYSWKLWTFSFFLENYGLNLTLVEFVIDMTGGFLLVIFNEFSNLCIMLGYSFRWFYLISFLLLFFFFFLKSINNDNKKKKKKKATFNDQTYCLNWLNNYGS